MAEALSARSRHARELFAPLGPTYDRYARLLSFGQDPRWRRFLVSRVAATPDSVVLDVATGTAAVAIELVRATGCSVVAIDQSHAMLETARERVADAGLTDRIRLSEASAEQLPFEDGAFDALTFTYLLRYVDDPESTLAELGRVVRPSGTIASLEFAVPHGQPWHSLWELYVRAGLPLLGSAISRGWRDVGTFLGPSIRGFYEQWPLERVLDAWRRAGIVEVESRALSLGGGVVTWGRRE